MVRFALARLTGMVSTLVFVSLLIFIIIELPPGDYADRYAMRLRDQGMYITENQMHDIRVQFGLDRIWPVRYVEWVTNIVTKGDFGLSWNYNRPVTDVIGERMGYTIAIATASLVLTYGIAIPIGIYSATHQYSAGDFLLSTISYLGLATPNFLIALLLMYVSMAVFKQDVGGLFSREFINAPWSWARFLDFFSHLWIPAIVLGFSRSAFQFRTMRSLMLDEVNKLYVTVARSKGLKEGRLLLKYPVRAALNPIASTFGWELTHIVSGAPIVSVVLGLPDTGPLLLQSLLDQDMNVAGALLLMFTAMTVLGTAISDILLVVLDPRIRTQEK